MTDGPMTFMDHLVELRRRLIVSVVAITIGTVVAAIFYEQLLDILADPYLEAVDGDRLAFFQPAEAFTLVLRVALFGGVVIASPVVIGQTWGFISPALTPRERRFAVPLSIVLAVLFTIGVVVGYLTLPLTLRLLLGIGSDILDPVIGAEYYLRFAMRFLLAFGLAFLFPVFLFAAGAAGVVTSRTLRSWRRWAVTVILVGAALLTPGGDPLTLVLLAGPLYILYEATILAIRFGLKK
ncbi:MAG: twin-arginine translocase subunit TatC [Acidimicrobiia bacterium]